MGTFGVIIEVGGPRGQRYEAVEALVATGATDTVLPSELIRRLNVEVIDRLAFRLADQRVEEYDVGETRIRLDGRERTVLVVFGPEGANALLGATTLELFHLGVDPIGQRLVPVQGLLMGLSRTPSRPADTPIARAHVCAPTPTMGLTGIRRA